MQFNPRTRRTQSARRPGVESLEPRQLLTTLPTGFAETQVVMIFYWGTVAAMLTRELAEASKSAPSKFGPTVMLLLKSSANV